MGVETALIAATVVSAGSAIAQGYQQNEMAKYEAKQQRADAATQQQAGEIEAEKIRKKARATAASTRAILAAKGLSIAGESANLINEDIASDAEMDALLGIDDSASAAGRLRANASLSSMRGRSARVSGLVKGATSALGTYAALSQSGWLESDSGGIK